MCSLATLARRLVCATPTLPDFPCSYFRSRFRLFGTLVAAYEPGAHPNTDDLLVPLERAPAGAPGHRQSPGG